MGLNDGAYLIAAYPRGFEVVLNYLRYRINDGLTTIESSFRHETTFRQFSRTKDSNYDL